MRVILAAMSRSDCMVRNEETLERLLRRRAS